MMKKLLIFSALYMIGTFLWAQTTERNTQTVHSKEWVLLNESNGVQQYYRFSECNVPESGFIGEYVQVRIVNTTSTAKQVEWDIRLWYNNECINCGSESPEYHRSVSVPARGNIESECSNNAYVTWNIYSASLNRKPDEWELTNFEFRNFTVK